VPQDLKSLVGKSEIRRSLRTGEFEEAKIRVRVERMKVDAEFARHRRLQKPPEQIELSDRDVWQLAAAWFVDRERKNLTRDVADRRAFKSGNGRGHRKVPSDWVTPSYVT
jgi:hypothetical protein